MSSSNTLVRFLQAGSRLTGVEIVRGSRAPVIGSLHSALVALGIVVSSYQVRTSGSALTERIAFERRDGGSIEATLSDAAKAAVLRATEQ